jgi:MYXO-CTERM domain-containing protein
MWVKRITRSITMLAIALLMGTALPVSAQTTADQTTTRDMDDDGFDWGLLGLLGLAGLLGRNRKDRTVTDTRRV